MKLELTPSYGLDDVLLIPNQMSNTVSRFNTRDCDPYVYEEQSPLLPLVGAPMDTVASLPLLEKTQNLRGIFTSRFHPKALQLAHIRAGAGAVMGFNTSDEDIEDFIEAGATDLLVDVANGGNWRLVDLLDGLQPYRDRVKLWAGNVATAQVYRQLMFLCDYIRVGIGNGAACLTRERTGVGYGQFTAIRDCVRERNSPGYDSQGRRKAFIVSDGGIKKYKHICISLAAGADLVMIGSLFAGTDESDAELALDGKYKRYRGLASAEVNRELGKVLSKTSVEGASGYISRTGPIQLLTQEMENALRSSMSYLGAQNLKEYRSKASFTLITSSVLRNEAAHGLVR